MELVPVSEVMQSHPSYRVDDVKQNAVNERWGFREAHKIMLDPMGRPIQLGDARIMLYSLEPQGGMTEPIALNRYRGPGRRDYDISIIRGMGKAVLYRSEKRQVEVSTLGRNHKRSLGLADAVAFVNSGYVPFIVQVTERPRLKLREFIHLTASRIREGRLIPPAGYDYVFQKSAFVGQRSAENDSWLLPAEFYESVGKVAAGHYGNGDGLIELDA